MKPILFSFLFMLTPNPLNALASVEVTVMENAIFYPLNMFLLVERGRFLGAVIFLSYEKNNQGDFVRYRNYGYQYSSNSWQEENEGTIAFRNLSWWQRAMGAIGFHTPPIARIRPIKWKNLTLFAQPSMDGRHATILFGASPTRLDPTIKFAPTPWRTIEEVNPKDPRLKWYEAGNPELKFKIYDLWK